MHTKRGFGAVAATAAVLALMGACAENAPMPTESSAAGIEVAPTMAAARHGGNSERLAQLGELRAATAKYHSGPDGYPILFIDVPKTTANGCVSDTTMGGMGFHYAKPIDPATSAPTGIADRHLDFLDPELLVYAPKNGHSVEPGGDPEFARLAAFDYFVPFALWDSLDPPPTSADLGLAIDPAIPFQWSRFGGWMFHIWPWAHNPAGMFANWNPAVPLCTGSKY
jgi:hypothetical protein